MPSRSPPTYTANSVSGLSARPRPTNSLGPSPCVPQTEVPTAAGVVAVPGQTGKACAVAANRVSGPRTQSWKVRRKPGSQPKVRPGTVAADLSPLPRERRLLYVPEAEGTNPAPQDSFGKAREAIQ